ncbi:MAG: FtsW/RodA/SpoVE family cell cycle protein [Ruminococcus sp.]|jgi:rod shape determining protein RodA|nr:FtsW/RodA/SpoVE family cell cycle protein [Ruminococcus sp.]
MLEKFLTLLHGYFRKLDKQLFFAVLLLGAFSVLLLYSMDKNGILAGGYKMQAVTFGLGAAAALIISALDYRKFTKLWVLFAPACIILCLLTFTSLGYRPNEYNDDVAWLDLGFTTVQPSEFLKLAFIMTFALHLSKVKEHLNSFGNIILLCIHAAVPMAIIFLQGDDGTLIIVALIFLSMLFAAGLSWKYIIPAIVVSPAAIWAAWNYVMADYQKARFLVLFTDYEGNEALETVAYQQEKGLLALGSGKITGNGLFAEQYVYVPEIQNDFIFTYIGETLGFVGCIATIAVLGYVSMKLIADSRIAKDDLGKFLCIGVWALIFFHCVLNLGMVMFITPVIGVPLPFVSQGGTAMLSMFAGIGIVMSTYSHSEKIYRVFYDYE